MDINLGFKTIWERVEDFELPEPKPDICEFAQEFAKWTGSLLKVTEDPEIVFVNQAKVLLLDKYFEWRNFVPRNHKNRTGPKGHLCVFGVFEDAYKQLKTVELALTPPLLFLPPPPEPPPQIAGLFLGDLEE